MRPVICLLAMCIAIGLVACGEEEAGSPEHATASNTFRAKPDVPQGPTTDELVVRDLIEGTGAPTEEGDLMVIHYVGGVYETGKEIESAWVRGQPFGVEVGLGKVLPAWEEGLSGMRVGGRRMLIFPTTPEVAPMGSEVGDTLVYIIDLLRLRKNYVGELEAREELEGEESEAAGGLPRAPRRD